jgi:hypothetical protein
MNTTYIIVKFITTSTVGYLLLLGFLSGSLHLSLFILGLSSVWLVNRMNLN